MCEKRINVIIQVNRAERKLFEISRLKRRKISKAIRAEKRYISIDVQYISE